MSEIVLVSVSFALGFCLVSYTSFARSRGWIIADWISTDSSLPAMFGFALCAFSVGRGLFYVQPWWSGLIAIPVGFLLALALTLSLRNWTPVIAIPLGLVTLVAQVILLFR